MSHEQGSILSPKVRTASLISMTQHNSHQIARLPAAMSLRVLCKLKKLGDIMLSLLLVFHIKVMTIISL